MLIGREKELEIINENISKKKSILIIGIKFETNLTGIIFN